MSAKFTSLIWQSSLDRPLKLVALVLADSADTHGVISVSDKIHFTWLTGYSVEALDKILSKLINCGVLVQLPEQKLRFSSQDIPPLQPYWQVYAAADANPETLEEVKVRLAGYHLPPDTVAQLVQNHPADHIQQWSEVFEQAQKAGMADGSGYLVSALKHNWDIEAARKRIAHHMEGRDKTNQAAVLPQELLDLLEALGWDDDLEEVLAAYRQNPERTLAWAMHTKKTGWGAGKFRKSLRSGLNPPNHEPVLRPPVAILEIADSSQNDWPEATDETRTVWQQALKRISLMNSEERGFNLGDFISWVKPAMPISIESTGMELKFTVKSCTPTAADWIDQNARGVLEDVLEEILSQSVSIETVS